jgi:uncharacterized protein YndB with AHSA1/START domain
VFKKSNLVIVDNIVIMPKYQHKTIQKMRSINLNAPVKCSKSISINASCEKVWKILTDINHWANWQTDISNPKINGELKPETTFTWKTGGAKINSTLHTVEPSKKFGWTGKTFGLFAIHNWTLTESNGITIVTVDESMEGFLASILKSSFNKNLEKGMLHWLNLLKQTCEE